MNDSKGFTLVELMVVVVIITILALIAIPSYKNYMRRAELSQAQQEMQKIADQLERYKGRSFSYNGFKLVSAFDDSAIDSIDEASTSLNAKYVLTVLDADKGTVLSSAKMASEEDGVSGSGLGHSWKMKAISTDLANYSLAMNSNGLQCKTIDQVQVQKYQCVDQGMGEAW
jgi:type IV pilus assembly protein PilE